MDGWTDGRTDGWMVSVAPYVYSSTHTVTHQKHPRAQLLVVLPTVLSLLP